jgi:hypothetical protein
MLARIVGSTWGFQRAGSETNPGQPGVVHSRQKKRIYADAHVQPHNSGTTLPKVKRTLTRRVKWRIGVISTIACAPGGFRYERQGTELAKRSEDKGQNCGSRAGSFAPSFDRSLVGGLSHQVEGEMAYNGHVPGAVAGARRDWSSLIEGHVEGPVQVVFDGPSGSARQRQRLRPRGHVRKCRIAVRSRFFSALDPALDHVDGDKFWEPGCARIGALRGIPIHGVDDRMGSYLQSAVLLTDGL